MKKLDRELQLEILTKCKDNFPDEIGVRNLSTNESEDFQPNLFYLSELGLIQPVAMITEYPPRKIITAKITARGLDFLEDDGGISAIMKTFTVRLDLESIRALMENKILTSNLPDGQKKTFTEKIKNLSSDVLKTVVLRLVEKAIENPESLLNLLKLSTNQSA
ncbi:MAG: hypothetical protein HY276_00430 [Ignavibacteriales bacterium]|nr:hypothetical protein [Ignavibacteriales bacterium]MBI3786700.1 hypothetical protein [Ignavibacteriales bacterium]